MNPPQDIRLLAAIAIGPMLIDIAVEIGGLYSPTMLSRLLTGGWFGFLSSFFLIPVAIGAMRELIFRQYSSVANAH